MCNIFRIIYILESLRSAWLPNHCSKVGFMFQKPQSPKNFPKFHSEGSVLLFWRISGFWYKISTSFAPICNCGLLVLVSLKILYSDWFCYIHCFIPFEIIFISLLFRFLIKHILQNGELSATQSAQRVPLESHCFFLLCFGRH